MRGRAVRNLKCTQRLSVFFMMITLAGCAGLSEIPFQKLSTLSNVSFQNIDDPVAQGTPILLYSHVARNIKQCWLKPSDPLLKDHAFFARATPNKAGGRATITLNQITKTGKKGLTAFKIDFLPLDGGKTNVQIDNLRFPPELAKRLKANVRFWSTGQVDCTLPNSQSKITSIPSGVKIYEEKAKTK